MSRTQSKQSLSRLSIVPSMQYLGVGLAVTVVWLALAFGEHFLIGCVVGQHAFEFPVISNGLRLLILLTFRRAGAGVISLAALTHVGMEWGTSLSLQLAVSSLALGIVTYSAIAGYLRYQGVSTLLGNLRRTNLAVLALIDACVFAIIVFAADFGTMPLQIAALLAGSAGIGAIISNFGIMATVYFARLLSRSYATERSAVSAE